MSKLANCSGQRVHGLGEGAAAQMANVFMPMFAISMTGISYKWQDKISIVAPGGRIDEEPLFAADGNTALH